MKFLPVLLSLLSATTLTAARPVEDGLDPQSFVNAFFKNLGTFAPFAPFAPGPPSPPPPPPPPAPPAPPAPGPPCAVIATEPVFSESCPGNPNCEFVEAYDTGDLIDFKCYLAGYAAPGETVKAWVRVQEPWGYLPREYLDQECALTITEVCAEGKALPNPNPPKPNPPV